jgi:hypothetical protein
MESKKRLTASLDITATEQSLPVPGVASDTGTYPPAYSTAGLNVVGEKKERKKERNLFPSEILNPAVLITVCHFTD